MIRVRKLHGKCREFCVYKLILSHLCEPKTRNMNPKFTQHVTDGLELRRCIFSVSVDPFVHCSGGHENWAKQWPWRINFYTEKLCAQYDSEVHRRRRPKPNRNPKKGLATIVQKWRGNITSLRHRFGEKPVKNRNSAPRPRQYLIWDIWWQALKSPAKFPDFSVNQ